MKKRPWFEVGGKRVRCYLCLRLIREGDELAVGHGWYRHRGHKTTTVIRGPKKAPGGAA